MDGWGIRAAYVAAPVAAMAEDAESADAATASTMASERNWMRMWPLVAP